MIAAGLDQRGGFLRVVGIDPVLIERGPSRWLGPILETIAALEKEATPTAASEVSARVAELRKALEDGSEDKGRR